jgi:ComF family protein
VPLHPRRLRERGYNQSALLARRAAERIGVPVEEALARTRATAHQVGLDAVARAANVANAFELARGYPHLQGRRVLLIDDVRTSGATLGACAEAARAAGAVWVGAATLAHD